MGNNQSHYHDYINMRGTRPVTGLGSRHSVPGDYIYYMPPFENRNMASSAWMDIPVYGIFNDERQFDRISVASSPNGTRPPLSSRDLFSNTDSLYSAPDSPYLLPIQHSLYGSVYGDYYDDYEFGGHSEYAYFRTHSEYQHLPDRIPVYENAHVARVHRTLPGVPGATGGPVYAQLRPTVYEQILSDVEFTQNPAYQCLGDVLSTLREASSHLDANEYDEISDYVNSSASSAVDVECATTNSKDYVHNASDSSGDYVNSEILSHNECVFQDLYRQQQYASTPRSIVDCLHGTAVPEEESSTPNAKLCPIFTASVEQPVSAYSTYPCSVTAQTSCLFNVWYNSSMSKGLEAPPVDPYYQVHLLRDRNGLWCDLCMLNSVSNPPQWHDIVTDAKAKIFNGLSNVTSNEDLSRLIPTSDISETRNDIRHQRVSQIVEQLRSRIEQKDPRFRGIIIKIGSYHDGTKIHKADEYDLLLELDYSIFQVTVDNPERLTFKVELQDTTGIWEDASHDYIGRTVLSPKKVYSTFAQLVNEELKELTLPPGMKHAGPLSPEFANTRKSGPAVTMQLECDSESDRLLTVDITVALKVKVTEIQQVLPDFEIRKIDGLEAVMKTYTGSLHLVPISEHTWQLTTAGLDAHIMETLGIGHPAKSLIRMCKVLRDMFLCVKWGQSSRQDVENLLKCIEREMDAIEKQGTPLRMQARELIQNKGFNMFALFCLSIKKNRYDSEENEYITAKLVRMLSSESSRLHPAVQEYMDEICCPFVTMKSCVFKYTMFKMYHVIKDLPQDGIFDLALIYRIFETACRDEITHPLLGISITTRSISAFAESCISGIGHRDWKDMHESLCGIFLEHIGQAAGARIHCFPTNIPSANEHNEKTNVRQLHQDNQQLLKQREILALLNNKYKTKIAHMEEKHTENMKEVSDKHKEDVTNLTHKIQNMSDELDKLRVKVLDYESALCKAAKLTEENDSYVLCIRESMVKTEWLQNELDHSVTKIEAYNEELQLFRMETEKNNTEIFHLKIQLQQVAGDYEAYKVINERLNGENVTLQSERERLNGENVILQNERDNLETDELRVLNETITQANKHIKQLEMKNTLLEQDIRSMLGMNGARQYSIYQGQLHSPEPEQQFLY